MEWVKKEKSDRSEYYAEGIIGTGKKRAKVENAYTTEIAHMGGAWGDFPAVRCEIPFENISDAREFQKKLILFICEEVKQNGMG